MNTIQFLIIIIVINLIIVLIRKTEIKNAISGIKDASSIDALMIRMIAQIAFKYSRKIDPKSLSKKEKEILYRFATLGKHGFGLADDGSLSNLLEVFIGVVKDKGTFENNAIYRDAEIFYERSMNESIKVEDFYEILFSFSLNENLEFNETNTDILRSLSKIFHISENIFDQLYATYCNKDGNGNKNSYSENSYGEDSYGEDSYGEDSYGDKEILQKHFKTLDCSENSTIDDIKNSYNKLCKQYHPDKLIYKGLPDDMIKYAQERFVAITEAKDYLIDHIEKLRQEKERLEKERQERERLEKERWERERLERETLEKERFEKEGLVEAEPKTDRKTQLGDIQVRVNGLEIWFKTFNIGTADSTPIYCPKCKNGISNNSQECPKCGIFFEKYLNVEVKKYIDYAIKYFDDHDAEKAKTLLDHLLITKIPFNEKNIKTIKEYQQKIKENQQKSDLLINRTKRKLMRTGRTGYLP